MTGTYFRELQMLLIVVLHHHLLQCLYFFQFLLNQVSCSSIPLQIVACQYNLHNVFPSLSVSLSLSRSHRHTHTHSSYLHPEEGDAGQQINSRLQILESLWVSCRKVILE